MKIKLLTVLLPFLFLSCNTSGQQSQTTTTVNSTTEDAQPNITLTFLWETDTLLHTVESVFYDSEYQLIYTANINGHFMAKDGNGYLSKLNDAGEILEEKWVTGLDAPTGLGKYQDKLYTTDIDRIVEIDLLKGTILKIYPVPGAQAFNDVVVGMDGTVYCSDTGGNQIFALKQDSVFLVKDNIDTPNGLWIEKDKLWITQWTPQSISLLDLNNQNLSPVAGGIAGPDGLEPMPDGSFLASGFSGLIYHITRDGQKTLLLDTSGKQIKSADIDYIDSKKVLLVPTMDNHKIMAYQLNY